MSRHSKSKVTKFPVARIKRIMQKDDDVGKVAQATPVVISKALELFLEVVVKEASSVTTARGARKVEAYHLKHAINTTDTFDFLKELVEAVPDPSAGGTLPESGTTSTLAADDSGTEGTAVPGAPKRKRARRKPASGAVRDEDEDGEEKPKKTRAPRRKKGDDEPPKRRGKKAAAAAVAAAAAAATEAGVANEQQWEEEGEEEEDMGYTASRSNLAMDEDYEEEYEEPRGPWPAGGQQAQW